MTKTIAILKGDGIGPEIMREAQKALEAIGQKYGHSFSYLDAPFGANAYFKYGHPFPEETKRKCDEADAKIGRAHV